MGPGVSVVVVNYNAGQYLLRCLASLLEQEQGVSLEVLVVDNASRDGSAEEAESRFPQVRLLRRRRNDGFAVACNAGIAEARGGFVLILNPDTEVSTGALAPMVAYLRQHPEVGVLAPKILNPDGSIQPSCRRFPSYLTALFNRRSLLTRLLPRNRLSAGYLMTEWDHESLRQVDWASGACMLIPRGLFEAVGPFDEGFFLYVEDVDLCRRVHQAGYSVVYFPEAALVHHIGKSTEARPYGSILAWHRGMWRYYRKHMRGNPALDLLTGGGIALRCLVLLLLEYVRRLSRRLRASS